MSAPRVSVVMAAHDAEPTVAEALASMLNQTWHDFELLAVDDGSHDGTADVLRAVRDSRLHVVQNRENLGLARSLNLALRRARGAYVARMDADDRSHPERLARQVAFLDGHPEVVLVGTSFELIDADGRPFDRRVREGDDEILQAQLLRWNPFCHGSVMMRTATLRRLCGYDVRFHSAQDCDLWLRLAEAGRIASLPEVLYAWRQRAGSITHARRDRQKAMARNARALAWQRRLRGRDCLGRRLDRFPRTRRPQELLAEHCAVWGREALRQGGWAAAVSLFGRAFRLDPRCPRLWRAVCRTPRACLRALAPTQKAPQTRAL